MYRHASEESKNLEFAHQVLVWDKPIFTFDTPANKPLFELGAQPIEDASELLGGSE